MQDELRGTLIRQGITDEQYYAAVGKSGVELADEMRPKAEERAKTLLVLGKVAELEGVTVSDDEIAAEVATGKARYADQPRLSAYFDTARAQVAIRASLRRSRVVEKIIDEWLAAHPDHPAIPHVEQSEAEAQSATRAALESADDADVEAAAEPAAGA